MLYGRKPIGTVAYLGGVPAVLEEFCWSWGQMVQFNAEHLCGPDESVYYHRCRHSFHSWGRNELVREMRGDWLLMLDTDHAFDPDICLRLHDRMYGYGLDVVCGIYQYRHPPHPPVLFAWGKNGGQEGYVNIGGWGDKAHVWEVAAAGAGCLMVRRRVFERIERELKEGPFDLIGQSGEDMSFFSRLRRLGIKAFVDDRIECHHLAVRPLSLADYDKSQATLEELPESLGYVPG